MRTDRIRRRNAFLTKTLPRPDKSNEHLDRNKFLLSLAKDYVLYRIGFYRRDKTKLAEMRLNAEAVSNSFLFGSSDTTNIYKVWLAFMNAHFPGAGTNLFNNLDWLVDVARRQLWLDDDYAPVMMPVREEAANLNAAPVHAIRKPSQPAPQPAQAPQLAEATPTQPNRQEVFSGLLDYASRNNKPDTWIGWQFGLIFPGEQPADDLKRVKAKPSALVRESIVNSSKAYEEKLNAKSTPAEAILRDDNADPKAKAIMAWISTKTDSPLLSTIMAIMMRDHADVFQSQSAVKAAVIDMVRLGILKADNDDFAPFSTSISQHLKSSLG